MNIKKFMAGLSAFVIALTAAATPLQEVIKAPQVLPQTAVNASAATYGDYEYKVLDDGTAEIIDYLGSATTLSIPSEIDRKKVTCIGVDAFKYCTSLTSVTIPGSVAIIEYAAFENCSLLSTINVDSTNKYYCSVDGVLFNKDKTTLICYPAGKIAPSYKIPDSVTSIRAGAFAYCYALTNVYYTGTQEQWNNIFVGDGNDNLTGATIHYNYGSVVAPSNVSNLELKGRAADALRIG